MSNKVTWLSYEFVICKKEGPWEDVGGVYIFAGINPQNVWIPIYVGQATSFYTRFPTHERWSEAELRGATHIHAKVVWQEATRLKIERELIREYDPPLNIQLK